MPSLMFTPVTPATLPVLSKAVLVIDRSREMLLSITCTGELPEYESDTNASRRTVFSIQPAAFQ
jgi:hypothetical protein